MNNAPDIKHIIWIFFRNMTLRFPSLPGSLMQRLLSLEIFGRMEESIAVDQVSEPHLEIQVDISPVVGRNSYIGNMIGKIGIIGTCRIMDVCMWPLHIWHTTVSRWISLSESDWPQVIMTVMPWHVVKCHHVKLKDIWWHLDGTLSILVFYLRMVIPFYNCCDGFSITR